MSVKVTIGTSSKRKPPSRSRTKSRKPRWSQKHPHLAKAGRRVGGWAWRSLRSGVGNSARRSRASASRYGSRTANHLADLSELRRVGGNAAFVGLNLKATKSKPMSMDDVADWLARIDLDGWEVDGKGWSSDPWDRGSPRRFPDPEPVDYTGPRPVPDPPSEPPLWVASERVPDGGAPMFEPTNFADLRDPQIDPKNWQDELPAHTKLAAQVAEKAIEDLAAYYQYHQQAGMRSDFLGHLQEAANGMEHVMSELSAAFAVAEELANVDLPRFDKAG